MSRLSKRSVPVLTAVGLVAGVAIPLTSLTAYTYAATSPFCTTLPSKAAAITAQLTNLSNKVSQAWSQQDQKIAADELKVDQDVAADRAKADSDRAADFTKLEAKATTTAEQQAVKTYEAAVLSAVTTRRSAYDAARQAFRTGLKNAIAARRSTITSQLTAFQDSANAALGTAEASCSSDPSNGAVIRTTLQASLKSARETFQGDRKDDPTVGSQVQQLAATRKAAFTAADQALQASLSAARQALEQAFGGSTTV